MVHPDRVDGELGVDDVDGGGDLDVASCAIFGIVLSPNR